MLLCVLTLGVGGFFVAINTVTPDSVARYDLIVRVNPPGSGSVSPGGDLYDSGTPVPLTATASTGYQFYKWSGDASGTSPTITVTMDSDKSVTAYFIPVEDDVTLSTSVSPSGGGSISISPSSSDGKYDSGTRVTLTATPVSAYEFERWAGDASGSSTPTTIIMDRDKNVVANFVRQYTLTTSVSPSGSGSIAPSGGTYDCGDQVSLTATPSSGYRFDHWSGDATGASPRTTITMDSNKSVSANFTELYQRIEYTMPAGSIAGSEVLYSKALKAGDKVDGFVQLTGEYHSIDWSYEWTFQIIGPGGESIKPPWKGHWVNNNYHEFSFTASYAGTYKIRVYHASSYSKNLAIEIWPLGWYK